MNRLDSVRPEIVLDGWSFENDANGWGIIHISRIRNEGRGPILHMRGQLTIPGAQPLEKGGPFAGFFHEPVPFLGVGKELEVDWTARFQWRKGSTIGGSDMQMAPLHLTLYVADLHGRMHQTTYEMVATIGGLTAGVTNLVPGLDLCRRHTIITPWWRLRLRSHRGRLITYIDELCKRIESHDIYRKIMEELKRSQE
jgi:hypothetical protein